ncbi:MAG: PQQ-binding-like beta-propeller repeat protein [Chthoniobacteraceae bacterium]
MTRRLFPLVLFSLTRAVFSAETDWPQFRGPTGQGISAAVNVPIEWDATKNVKWSVELASRGWSSPVLVKDRLYLTGAVTDPGTSDVTLHALCCDAANGSIVWDTEIFRPTPESTAAMHRKNSLASPTPLVADDRLYVHFGHMGTAALDLDGKVLWHQAELKYPPTHGTGGSPILVGDALIFSCDGQKDPFVVGLDAKTGVVRWKTERNSPAKKQFSFSTPLLIHLDDKDQVISPGSGFVASYDPRDGHEFWRVGYGEGYSVVPRPVFAHGLLFLSSGFDAPILHAIKPAGASGDATATNIAWTQRKGAPNTPSSLVVGDEVYFVSDGGIATCADARTGDVHWSERLGGNFSASPVAAEGRVYFQNEAGVGFVVKAGKTYELLATNDLGERSLASYAVADGTLFIRTESHLWKIQR